MKEAEMKTKWCPWMKGQFPSQTNCIASGCAMWEPYSYWETEDGRMFYKKEEGRKLVEGGECGLKPKESEGCRL